MRGKREKLAWKGEIEGGRRGGRKFSDRETKRKICNEGDL